MAVSPEKRTSPPSVHRRYSFLPIRSRFIAPKVNVVPTTKVVATPNKIIAIVELVPLEAHESNDHNTPSSILESALFIHFLVLG